MIGTRCCDAVLAKHEHAKSIHSHYCLTIQYRDVKLDFSFLAFAVVFPLTFLISSTFARREQALSFLADFKSSLLTAALLTLSVDWPSDTGAPYNGRLQLPERFNAHVVKDSRELIKLVYEYLSMPQVSHGRNHVFWNKQRATKHIHALQNGIIQDINDYMYDFGMHTEEMKKHGFPSGEASRLHQYHQYMQQRFEHLRAFKYYRTPQSTRSFGRVYILVLPWFTGPCKSYESTTPEKSRIVTDTTLLHTIQIGHGCRLERAIGLPLSVAPLPFWSCWVY